MHHRTVFYISDGTAITAETLGHSLLTQFEDLQLVQRRVPFVDSVAKAEKAVQEIAAAAKADGKPPIVFNTIINAELSYIIHGCEGKVLDLFGIFLKPLEQALGMQHTPSTGKAHSMHDAVNYEHRIAATNYALSHDDGIRTSFSEAEVILVGVSRSGKTPTCLYMALNFGVRAANYPLTDDDLESNRLPEFLRKHKKKLYGLTIEPERLMQIRENRRPGSKYASMTQCRFEVSAAEAILQREKVPIISVTHASIEEIASRILNDLGIQKQLF
ncbi:MAG: kinase/pyrophosphorylase [Halothiobacillus sp.]|jgi:regulator of PEP synthase PpsR (kinase-PPPase family)|nr:kinase/pyrophosphorylase [Halothiobacillus sp.]